MRGKCGRVRGPQPVLFSARFRRMTSDPARGRGGHRHTLTLSPQAAITIETPITHAPTYSTLKVQPNVSYARFGRKTSDPTRGRGGTGIHNPLPPGCNHHQNAHHARSSIHNIYISIKSPVLAASSQTRPPPLREPTAPCPRFFAA